MLSVWPKKVMDTFVTTLVKERLSPGSLSKLVIDIGRVLLESNSKMME